MEYPLLFFSSLNFFFMASSDGQVINLTLRDVSWIVPFARELGNSVNQMVCDGDGLLQPQAPIMHQEE